MKLISLIEHGTCEDYQQEDIKSYGVKLDGNPKDFMGCPQFLALNKDFKASYYIGAVWLVKNKLSLVVRPKIDNLDYLDMFTTALSVKSTSESDYFSKCYGIDFDAPFIPNCESINQLTPLLITHYIVLLENLLKTGLRKDYINVTENLKCKVKGHIVISQQLKKNIIPGREDRNVCSFQVYTCDIPINRLLKKALLFVQKMLFSLMPSNDIKKQLQLRINRILQGLQNVSSDIEVSEVKKCRANKLFKNYSQAVSVAKDILRRYDYSLSQINCDNRSTPCFWMDMSRLFELYVYSKLSKAYPNQILFQVDGYERTKVDFIHKADHIIIDAKYKPQYKKSSEGIIPDIREISGYSRDKEILKNFPNLNQDEECKCLIIYPNKDSSFDESGGKSLWESSDSDSSLEKNFRNFRKLGISLPTVNQ